MTSWRGGREARRHHEVVAAREVFHVAAVLIHDGEALAALLGRAGLVDEDDAGVEEALLARDAREDRVGDDVGDAPRVAGVRRILLARDLLAVGRASHSRNSVLMRPSPSAVVRPVTTNCAPVPCQAAIWGASGIGVLLREGSPGRVGCRKTERLKLLVMIAADLRAVRVVAGEFRHRDRDGLELPPGPDVEIAILGARPARGRAGQRGEGQRGTDAAEPAIARRCRGWSSGDDPARHGRARRAGRSRSCGNGLSRSARHFLGIEAQHAALPLS